MNKLFIAAPQNEDANTLLHTKGSLSVKRGGGEFDFTLAPGPNPALDKDNIVIGRVLEGFEVLDVLNQSPVSQGQFLEGAFKFSVSALFQAT